MRIISNFTHSTHIGKNIWKKLANHRQNESLDSEFTESRFSGESRLESKAHYLFFLWRISAGERTCGAACIIPDTSFVNFLGPNETLEIYRFFFCLYIYIFFFLVMWKRCVRARAPLESATAWRADTATATVGGGWCAVVRWFQLDLVVHKDTNDRSCLPFPQTLSFFKNFLWFSERNSWILNPGLKVTFSLRISYKICIVNLFKTNYLYNCTYSIKNYL